MAMSAPTTSPAFPIQHTTELLFVDANDASTYASALRGSYRVATTTTVEVARQCLRRNPPAIVITELSLPDGSGVDICREAKTLPSWPSVLVTTGHVEKVPDALEAGCDGVLLKPFAPNLLFARIGRLARARAERLRTQSLHLHAKMRHLSERSELLLLGTNRVWPNTHCPYCQHNGVTSFEFASHRRAWYACLECKKVWIAKRQE
jgi:DNA-binding response OmpR family regulator